MGLQCPACKNELSAIFLGDICLDVCKGGCGGIWFDHFELQKVDEQHEHQGESVLDIERNPHTHVDVAMKRYCPKCEGVKMMRRYFSVKRQVEIDECPSCGGIWLDAGELRDIRNAFENEAERHKAFDEYFQDVFGMRLQQERKALRGELEQTRNSMKAFKYICPSYWIPGDQPWGAF